MHPLDVVVLREITIKVTERDIVVAADLCIGDVDRSGIIELALAYLLGEADSICLERLLSLAEKVPKSRQPPSSSCPLAYLILRFKSSRPPHFSSTTSEIASSILTHTASTCSSQTLAHPCASFLINNCRASPSSKPCERPEVLLCVSTSGVHPPHLINTHVCTSSKTSSMYTYVFAFSPFQPWTFGGSYVSFWSVSVSKNGRKIGKVAVSRTPRSVCI